MIKIGIIGCGKIAQSRHIPELLENKDAELYGLTDINRERCTELAVEYGVKQYENYAEMLEDQAIDAVVVCTANSTHAEIACAAMKKGKDVLCEKPIADSLENARKIAACQKETGRKLMIGQNQRFDVVHTFAKEALDSGKLGKILRFQSNFITGGPENWSVDPGKNTWFFKKEKAGMGAMGDIGIHKIDFLRYILGEKFSEICAFIGTLDKKDADGRPIELEDSAVILAKTPSGIIGTISAGWTYYGDGMDNSTVLYCEKGVIKMYQSLKKNPCVIEYSNGDTVTFNPPTIWGNSQIVNHFVDTIKNNTPSPIDAEEALEVLEAVYACFESSRTGKTIVL